ncbi:zinc-dependent dehydrogenase [Candidatus Caldatribacterium sp.]|uniref:zinc-dependent dehydrogenase n=1 Tax=Candidatus Caldatribacterium sp. TaxID=2282143 RepID=UPI00299A6AAB|nr:zinc-dependent dehydrogenase [Candidatus Caldatribacterium sp.]MDW8081820.1 zinc-dependent dehydrogenase [Candidatus Calescibacterium sp.]
MKAAVFYGPLDLRVEERPIPQVGKGDVLVRVEACAICGTDVRIFHFGHRAITKPQILGHEIAGTIAEKGDDVEGYEVGDRVVVDPIVSCGQCFFCQRGLTNLCLVFKERTEAFGYYYPGGFAEYVLVPEKAVRRGNLIKFPTTLSFEEAAIAEPMACALNGQLLSRVGLGDRVLVIGAGPVGCMHIALAKVLGAAKVLVAEMQKARLVEAERFGADRLIDPTGENLREVVLAETQGLGPDVVIVAASSRQAQEEAIELVAPRGRVNFFGGLPKDDRFVTIDGNTVHYKELFIHGTSGATASHIRTCLDLMSAGRIDGKAYISKIIALDALPEMLREIQKGPYLKVVVKP